MKKGMQFLAVAGMLVFSINSFAKGQAGVYMSASDYTNKKATYSTNCKIHPNNSVADLPYITVAGNGKKIKLGKGEVYGYVDAGNNTYRFYENAEYQIVENGGVFIYTQQERTAQGKGYTVATKYYFSASADGKIYPLTLGNLKSVYRTNEQFISLLGQFFSGNDVSAYDGIHKKYMVNYVLGQVSIVSR